MWGKNREKIIKPRWFWSPRWPLNISPKVGGHQQPRSLGHKSPAELPGELAVFWRDLLFFLKTGGGLKQHQGLFLFWWFFLSEGIDGMFDQQQKWLRRISSNIEKGSSFFQMFVSKKSTATSLMFRAVWGWTDRLSFEEDVFCHYIGTQFWLSRRIKLVFGVSSIITAYIRIALKRWLMRNHVLPLNFNMDAWPKLLNSMLQRRRQTIPGCRYSGE